MALSDYEDALKSFVHDDDKLVTYKWLSKEFEIHVNLAKDILKQYWEKYKNKENILATLLLVGQLKDGSIRVAVVKETDLDSVKQKFVKIDCEHLYSIQKSLPDIELLALVGEGDLRYSAIKCNEEYIRNDDEIEGLRYIGNVRKEESKSMKTSTTINKAVEKPIPKKVELSPTEKPKKQSGKKDELSPTEKSKKQGGKKDELSPTEKSKKQGGKKDEVKDKEKPEEKEKANSEPTIEKKKSPPNKSSNSNSKSNNKASKKPIQSKQSGFNNLFGKVPNKPQIPPNKPVDSQKDKQISSLGTNEKDLKPSSKETVTKLTKEKEKSNKTKDQEKVKKETQEKENIHSQSEEKSKKVAKSEDKSEKSKPKAKTETRGKKRNRSQEKNKLSKRKRILVLDSSEDESGKSESDEEEPMEIEEILPKVMIKRSPSPPPEKRENGKRMVRKTIDKTFKDEEGFLVTKRVHVYEAVSDNEEASTIVEPQKPKPIEAQAKKKQTTLMNFFKKS